MSLQRKLGIAGLAGLGVLLTVLIVIYAIVNRVASEESPSVPPMIDQLKRAAYDAPTGTSIFWLGGEYPVLSVSYDAYWPGPSWFDTTQRFPLPQKGTVPDTLVVDVVTYLDSTSTYAPADERLLMRTTRDGESVAVFIQDYTGEPTQDAALRSSLATKLAAAPRAKH
jgi:hypothetical protein